jgi:L-alanine-DL-glutamate epimerase-like enolase superfamily enzyme
VRYGARGKIVGRMDTYSRPSESRITDGRVVASPMVFIEVETDEGITGLGKPLISF